MTVKKSIQVAYYWPLDGGYGVPKVCTSRKQAKAIAAEWAVDAAKTNGRAVIHILETVQRVTKVDP